MTDSAPQRQADDGADITGAGVSVVIPTRDRDQLLLRALEGVGAQDVPCPLEIIVVRDGTPTVPLAPSFPRRVTLRQIVNRRTPGLAGTRNTGILAATHPLIAFCDDDDEWVPGKLAAQLDLLRAHPEVSLVGTGIVVVHGSTPTPRIGPVGPVHLADLLADRIMELHPSGFLLRAADLRGRIGLVDEELPGSYAEDYDLLLRAAAVGPVLSVPRPLTRVHWHGGSYYFSRWQTIHDSLEMLLAKHPQFEQVPRGLARIRGQQALALAAMGRRREALRLARTCLRLSWRERRAYLTVLVALRLVSVERLQGWLHRLGRGL
ncbi:MAG: glycosyltransferase family 2 protein [Actinomycetota bacterium]|nr:glycosyltransferase family 2 protein [Actinomycetota bacterium]